MHALRPWISAQCAYSARPARKREGKAFCINKGQLGERWERWARAAPLNFGAVRVLCMRSFGKKPKQDGLICGCVNSMPTHSGCMPTHFGCPFSESSWSGRAYVYSGSPQLPTCSEREIKRLMMITCELTQDGQPWPQHQALRLLPTHSQFTYSCFASALTLTQVGQPRPQQQARLFSRHPRLSQQRRQPRRHVCRQCVESGKMRA